jgi:hypothetical protein
LYPPAVFPFAFTPLKKRKSAVLSKPFNDGGKLFGGCFDLFRRIAEAEAEAD